MVFIACYYFITNCTAVDLQYLVGEARGKATPFNQFIITNVVIVRLYLDCSLNVVNCLFRCLFKYIE